jgi:tetratricopeptide (TPR) repeat protein
LKEQLKESKQKSEEQIKTLETRFPAFRNMDATVAQMIGLLKELVPDVERLSDHIDKLTVETQERVLYFERSAAFFEFLSVADIPAGNQVFRRLGRFYRSMYEKEKRQNNADTVEARRLLERAKIYIDRALYSHPRDFASMNELANIIQESERSDLSEQARIQFEASARTQPKQQRALYWLGYIAMGARHYSEAENYFTQALSTDIWEMEPSTPERKWDLFYNRACVRSLMGARAQDPTIAAGLQENALKDLAEACPPQNKTILATLQGDIKTGGDLEWLHNRESNAIAEILRRLVSG